MSMSSPEVREKPPATEPSAEVVSVRSESWSLLRWLIVAGLIVVVGGSATAIVKMMPTEGLPGEEAKKFLRNTKPDGPPGRATLAEDATFNFGVMPQKQKGTHTWVLKNEGSGDLLLSMGDHDCSCTVANFSDNEPTYNLKAGTQTEVTLSWDTRTYDGGMKKHAAINVMNDPDRSSVVFTIEGSVRPWRSRCQPASARADVRGHPERSASIDEIRHRLGRQARPEDPQDHHQQP